MATDGSLLAGLIVGALAGVAAGLLLAPKTGIETLKILGGKDGEYVSNFRNRLRTSESDKEIGDTGGPSRPPPNRIRTVDAISGIGPALMGRLESGGITNVGDLAAAQPSEVARLLRSTEEQAVKFIDAARDMTEQ